MTLKNTLLHTVLVVLPIWSSLTGCQRDAVSAPPAPAPVAGAATQAFQLVTQRRPLSVQEHFKMHKAGYDMCVTLAELKNLPVQPFVAIPADFIAERTTHSSDGKSFYSKTQHYDIDIPGIVPENGCATSIAERSQVERISQGKIEQMGADRDGKTETTTRTDDQPEKASAAPDDISLYTVARKDNGIALKCLPPDHPVLHAGMTTELCVIDAGAGRTLRWSNGSAIVAYSRVTIVEQLSGISVIEPVSVQLGKFDVALFSGPLK